MIVMIVIAASIAYVALLIVFAILYLERDND